MDIVIEQVPEVPEQPQLQREVTGQFEDTQEQPDLTATQEDLPNPIEPPPKRRGRPPGSKNKPTIIEEILEEPYQTLIPIPTQVIEHPPRPEPIVLNKPPPKNIKLPAPRKPRAPKAQRQAPQPTPQAPVPQTPLQIAAPMLEILRLEQADRQWRQGELYNRRVR